MKRFGKQTQLGTALGATLRRLDRKGHGASASARVLTAWQVEEALRMLSDEHRSALIEVHYKSRPYHEVAASLGVPVGTVKSRVYYALKAMRLALEELGWTRDE